MYVYVYKDTVFAGSQYGRKLYVNICNLKYNETTLQLDSSSSFCIELVFKEQTEQGIILTSLLQFTQISAIYESLNRPNQCHKFLA